MAYLRPGTPYFEVTRAEARPMRFCQSRPAASSRVLYASHMAITEYGAALAYARMAPQAPINRDGHNVGGLPTSTWKPCCTSRIICMTFSRLPELSLMAMMLGCSLRPTTASTEISTPVVCGQL